MICPHDLVRANYCEGAAEPRGPEPACAMAEWAVDFWSTDSHLELDAPSDAAGRTDPVGRYASHRMFLGHRVERQGVPGTAAISWRRSSSPAPSSRMRGID